MLAKLVFMTFGCPKCGRTVPDYSVYCPYCGYGIKPSARSTQVSVGGAFLIVATAGSLILSLVCLQALARIYSWYPPLVAQMWFVYDQMLTVSSFSGFLFGLPACILSLTRRSYRWTMVSAAFCTLSGGGTWVISMIIPHSDVFQSFLFYFLPLFATSFIGTMLIFFRKAEFNSKDRTSPANLPETS